MNARLMLVLMLIVLLALPMVAQAQEAEPKAEAVVSENVEAVNNGNVAAAEETMAEDATVTVPAVTTTGEAAPAPTEGEGEAEAAVAADPAVTTTGEGEGEGEAEAAVAADPAATQQYAGTAETTAYLDAQAKANANTTLGECSTAGETVTCPAVTYTSDALQARGIDFLEGQLVVTVVEGKIQTYDFIPSAASVAMIQSAFAEGAAADLNLPTSGGEVPDSSRNTVFLIALGTLLLVLGGGVGYYRFGQMR